MTTKCSPNVIIIENATKSRLSSPLILSHYLASYICRSYLIRACAKQVIRSPECTTMDSSRHNIGSSPLRIVRPHIIVNVLRTRVGVTRKKMNIDSIASLNNYS